jgi:hypothetical protein
MDRSRTCAASSTRFGEDGPFDGASQGFDECRITRTPSRNDHSATTTQILDQLLENARSQRQSATATMTSMLTSTSSRGIEDTLNRSPDERLPKWQVQMDRTWS